MILQGVVGERSNKRAQPALGAIDRYSKMLRGYCFWSLALAVISALVGGCVVVPSRVALNKKPTQSGRTHTQWPATGWQGNWRRLTRTMPPGSFTRWRMIR